MKHLVLVIDSFGLGALPDAGQYGDTGSNTAGHIGQAVGGAQWPWLKKLGLGNAGQLIGTVIPGCEPMDQPLARFAAFQEQSPGKDTTTGHWELAGLKLSKAFHTFPAEYPSFPAELTAALETATGLKFLGNKAASGTEIIQELGDEHVKTGSPIIYTSSDSVFQIAAHEGVIPREKLYEICKIARKLCDPYQVARVIARPFAGSSGAYERTAGRHDYSIDLPGRVVMQDLQASGVETIGIGKIGDIFNEQGLDRSLPVKGNPACLAAAQEVLAEKSAKPQFIFVNLVDTDMIYGHRRDPQGYHDSVAATDAALAEILSQLGPGDSLSITADHGCDPTFRGSDHTREHVPFLLYGPNLPPGSAGIRASFADAAQTWAALFGVKTTYGKSLL